MDSFAAGDLWEASVEQGRRHGLRTVHGSAMFGLLVLFSSTGCSMFMGANGDTMAAAKPLEASEEVREYEKLVRARRENAIVLEVANDGAGGRVLPLPAGGQPVFLNDLLTQTGVAKKMGSMAITLYRIPERGGGLMPMKARWDADKNCVDPATDYALRAGDRVYVERASGSGLLDSILGALGPLGGFGG